MLRPRLFLLIGAIVVLATITLESIINQNPLKGSIKDIFGVWNFNKHTVME